jgi:transcriptional regulator with XRE-family HTH domain
MDTVETLDARFAKWIEEQCARPGFSRRELAAAMGLTEGMISKITTGIRQMKASEFELARRYFGADTVLLPGKAPAAEPVGIIEAGVYRDDDASRRAVVANPYFSPSNFPGFRLFAIAGDGMEALRPRPVCDGDYVICTIPENSDNWVPDLEQDMLVVIDRAPRAIRDGSGLCARSTCAREMESCTSEAATRRARGRPSIWARKRMASVSLASSATSSLASDEGRISLRVVACPPEGANWHRQQISSPRRQHAHRKLQGSLSRLSGSSPRDRRLLRQ